MTERLCEWCDEPATVHVEVERTKGGYAIHACEAHEKLARNMADSWAPASEGSLADEFEKDAA